MSIVLRPYQADNFEELREQLRHFRSVLYCLPTGGGKGTVISKIVASAVSKGKHVIFAVRGLALCHDMSRRLKKLGIEHGVLMGGHKRERWHPVQVASIDTLHRMKHKPVCHVLIIDEARTFMSRTGRMVLDEYPDVRVVGMDATPALLGGQGLGVETGGIFESMVTGPTEQELIDMGFLSPSIPIGTIDPPDVTGVEKTGGDFNQKKLAEICDKVKLVGDIVENWLRHGEYRKTLAFGVDQAHALHIKEQFCSAGIEFEYVDSSTPDDEREDIYERLDRGSLVGLSNCMIAGVGFDHPVISCIISARPTASLTLWRQMIGRGGRVCPDCVEKGSCKFHPTGKKNFIILDSAGNGIRHWPYGFFETPPLWTLNGPARPPKDRDKATPVSMCKRPVAVPETGIPDFFKGPISKDGKFMLPGFHQFRAGPEICPYCGIPLRGPGRIIEVEAGILQDQSALRDDAKADVKAKSASMLAYEERLKEDYLKLVKEIRTTRRKNGFPFSENYPAMQFKLKHHRFPKKEWKDEALRLYGPPLEIEELQESLI